MAANWMEALERANAIRTARAELKCSIRRGEARVSELLTDDLPDEAHTMLALELLMAQRHWGSVRSRRVLSRLMIRENRQVGELTERQCALLAEAVQQPPGAIA